MSKIYDLLSAIISKVTNAVNAIPKKLSELENDAGFITEQKQADWNQNSPSVSDYIKNKPFHKEKEIVTVVGESEFVAGENGEIYTSISRQAWIDALSDSDQIDIEITLQDVATGKTMTYNKDNSFGFSLGYNDSLHCMMGEMSGFGFGVYVYNGCEYNAEEEDVLPNDSITSVVVNSEYEVIIRQLVLYSVDHKRLPEWSIPKYCIPSVVNPEAFGAGVLVERNSTGGEFWQMPVGLVKKAFDLVKWAKKNNAILYSPNDNCILNCHIFKPDTDIDADELLSVEVNYNRVRSDGVVVWLYSEQQFYIDRNGEAWYKGDATETRLGKIGD